MPKKKNELFVYRVPKCKKCGNEFIISEIITDNKNCSFLLVINCIKCNHSEYFALSLEDFIELNQEIFGVK